MKHCCDWGVMPKDSETHSAGVQSLNTALRLLTALSEQKGPVSLSDLARDCEMSPSKTHRYLSSFLQAGFVEQVSRSGKYDLGPSTVRLGLAGIARHDFVNRASDRLADLVDATDMSALLSVWGNQGATVIRWERAEWPAVTSMGLGTTLPLLHSATGRAFLAWAPKAPLAASRETELRRIKASPSIAPDLTPTARGIADLIERVRAQGFAAVDGMFIPGLVALAAPILDWQGQAQAVVSLIGTDQTATRQGSDAVKKLLAFCRDGSFAPTAGADE